MFLLIVFISDELHSQTIITAAGDRSGISGGDGGPFSQAGFAFPFNMLYDKAGNLYLTEYISGSIRRVDGTTGIITTFATPSNTGSFGMAFNKQESIIYVSTPYCVYSIDMASKAVSIIAGIPGLSCTSSSQCGDGGLATKAMLAGARGLAVDSLGNVYIADNGNSRIRKVDITTGIISTVVGGGGCNCVGLGDGGPANLSTLLFPEGILFDKNWNLFIVDGGLHNVRKVDANTGIIKTIAGGIQGGMWGYSGDGGPAVNARFSSPSGIFLDANNNLYIADANNHAIRKIDSAGLITTIAGMGKSGYLGDCGPATNAMLSNPKQAVITPANTVLIADLANNVFREIINAAPNVISASTTTLCEKSSLTLTNSAQGGVWSSSNPSVASVNAQGVTKAVSPGITNVSYNIVNGCNTASSSVTLTVIAAPEQPTISGLSAMCKGQTTQVKTTIPGGVWSTSDSSVAVAGISGTVNGISAGIATIKYSLSNAGCTVADSLQVLVNAPPANSPVAGDSNICVNSALVFSSSIAGGIWSSGNTSALTINPVSGSVTAIKAGYSKIQYTLSNNCGSSTADKIVKVNALPAFSLGADTAVCTNETIQLNPATNAGSFLWENGSTLLARVINEPGEYFLKLVDANNCSYSDTIRIAKKSLPQVYIGADTTLCNSSSYTINARNNLIAIYNWQDGSSQPAYTINRAGVYSVTVTGINSCKNSDTMHVNYISSPSVSLGGNTTICPGNSITITPPVNNVSYLWSDGSTNPSLTITAPGNYWLNVSNFCGSSTAAIQIGKGTCQLFLPNAFTPNSDGLNDIFRVKYSNFIKTFQLSVFNRWGQKIFETTDPKKGWNGTYNNTPQPAGAYAWVMALTSLEGKYETTKGTILLIR